MSESSEHPPRTAPPSPDPDDYESPEFEPAHPRPRFDGWTPKRQVAFIQALAESACVSDACRSVGMSERSAYALRARADAVSFRNAWDSALDYAIRRLSDAALSRAINGVAVPIFFKGEHLGEKRHYDERLTMFLLRYRDPLRYGKWLDQVEYGGHSEAAATELTKAKVAVREDAGLSFADLPGRFAKRLREIALTVLRSERGRPGRPYPREDVP